MTQEFKTKIQNVYMFTISMPPGYPGVSADLGETTKFDFLGLECNHEALEPLETKNLSKSGIFYELCLFFRGFWLLAISE